MYTMYTNASNIYLILTLLHTYYEESTLGWIGNLIDVWWFLLHYTYMIAKILLGPCGYIFNCGISWFDHVVSILLVAWSKTGQVKKIILKPHYNQIWSQKLKKKQLKGCFQTALIGAQRSLLYSKVICRLKMDETACLEGETQAMPNIQVLS